MKKKLVIVADDHPLIREGLERLIQEQYGSVTLYSADDARQLLPLVDRCVDSAQVLTVADISLARGAAETASGSTTPADGHGATGGPPLMVVSMRERGITANWFVPLPAVADTTDDVQPMHDAFSRREVVMELIESLHHAARGPARPESVSSGDVPSTESLVRLGLTRRQAEVLASLAEGLTNKEIARKLQVSEWTVRHHVSAILERLDVSTRGRAALFARRLAEETD